ncbi:MAG: MauE/DoxX family redox-associated membrane protein [candidate division FCPU426 bacterium]
MNPGARRAVAAASAWLLAGIFLFAGLEKWLQPGAFADAIADYRLLPGAWVNLAAVLIPAWEIAAALALLVPGWRRSGALIILGLCAVFFAAVVSALARGLDIDCGCFGPLARRADWMTLLLDLALGACALYLAKPSRGGT